MLSWVWESKLVDCGAEIEVVNDYKASRASGVSKSSVTLSSFSKRYRGATASASGRCFFEAIQAVAHMLGRPEALPLMVWLRFVEIHGEPANGVTKRDMAKFFKFLRTARCHIDAGAITRNHLNKSTKTVQQLGSYARELSEGWYIVHAGEQLREHCFALHAQGPDVEPAVIDKFDDSATPPCRVEPFDNLKWIRRVVSIRRVRLLPQSFEFPPEKKQRTN
ncbi:hypothetical protein PR003_g2396 [Phytophthora rubi]|uniref:Uncharacterized protein n=1 Tax=Phytophthora rubi TaxID=129364 RepID=A0A6A4FSU2_9STRA|nr:hypothetical protein PR003_g2396 [Phytophthora rubi]